MMQRKKPSSLWAQYSMLKSTLKIYDRVDIEKYATLTAMLKQNSHGYEPKQAKTFTDSEAQQFLDNAPDDMWLDVKVTSLFLNFYFFSYSVVHKRLLWFSEYADAVGPMSYRRSKWNISNAMMTCTTWRYLKQTLKLGRKTPSLSPVHWWTSFDGMKNCARAIRSQTDFS